MAGSITKRVNASSDLSVKAEAAIWQQTVSTAFNEYFDYNKVGDGTPEANVIAVLSAVFHRRDTGKLYVKETETVSGVPDNTGWVLK